MSESLQLPEVVHHLYRDPGDLVPFCGVMPGSDELTGDWHTGHDRELLLECIAFGLPCCTTCLSPQALGGWTPLILSDDGDEGIDCDEI